MKAITGHSIDESCLESIIGKRTRTELHMLVTFDKIIPKSPQNSPRTVKMQNPMPHCRTISTHRKYRMIAVQFEVNEMAIKERDIDPRCDFLCNENYDKGPETSPDGSISL